MTSQKKANDEKLAEISHYSLKTASEFEKAIIDDYKALVKEALLNNGDYTTDNDGNKTISVNYEAIINDYAANIEGKKENIPTIKEFINSNDNYKNLTDAQKSIFETNYSNVQDKITHTPLGNYTVYNSNMLITEIDVNDDTATGGIKTYNEKTYRKYRIFFMPDITSKLFQFRKQGTPFLTWSGKGLPP